MPNMLLGGLLRLLWRRLLGWLLGGERHPMPFQSHKHPAPLIEVLPPNFANPALRRDRQLHFPLDAGPPGTDFGVEANPVPGLGGFGAVTGGDAGSSPFLTGTPAGPFVVEGGFVISTSRCCGI